MHPRDARTGDSYFFASPRYCPAPAPPPPSPSLLGFHSEVMEDRTREAERLLKESLSSDLCITESASAELEKLSACSGFPQCLLTIISGGESQLVRESAAIYLKNLFDKCSYPMEIDRHFLKEFMELLFFAYWRIFKFLLKSFGKYFLNDFIRKKGWRDLFPQLESVIHNSSLMGLNANSRWNIVHALEVLAVICKTLMSQNSSSRRLAVETPFRSATEDLFYNKFPPIIDDGPPELELMAKTILLPLLARNQEFIDKAFAVKDMPSAQEIVSLPSIDHRIVPGDHYQECLGFGYAVLTKVYKVFRLFSLQSHSFCMVFSVGLSQCWSRARASPPFRIACGSSPILSWAVHLLPAATFKDGYIAAFSVELESYQRISLPIEFQTRLAGDSSLTLTVLRGELYLLSETKTWGGCVKLWTLRGYEGDDWVILYNIDLTPLNDSPLMVEYPPWVRPVAVVGDDGDLVISICGTSLLKYDPEVRVLKWKIGYGFSSTFFIEILFPLHHRCWRNENFLALRCYHCNFLRTYQVSDCFVDFNPLSTSSISHFYST